MSKHVLLKLVRTWWAGVKVFFRWSAFYGVLFILGLPAMGLIGLVGDYAGYALGTIFLILVVPLVFYLTSRYLLLLGDSENNRTDCTDHTEVVQESPAARISTRRVTVVAVPIVFSIVAAILTPPDVISQIFLMAQMLIVAGVLAFIVSRFKSFAHTPENIRRLIIVLVCLLSMTTAYSIMSFGETVKRVKNAPPESSFDGAFTFNNLWVGTSSDGKGTTVVCSADSPETYTVGGKTNLWMLTFPGGNSVEFDFVKNQTVWIDEQHRVTLLGRVLDKDDVSLMHNQGHDATLKISSPDDLLTVIKKLRTEQAASTAPPEAAGN